MNTFCALWSKMVDSSIWSEPDHVRIVWITMMALKDFDQVCRLNAFQLARRANKTEEEVMDALMVLSSPDTKRVEKQEYGGRRIKAVEEGWLVLNGDKYQRMMKEEMQRMRWRRAQAAQRKKKAERAKMDWGMPSPGEISNKKQFEAGSIDEYGQPILPSDMPPADEGGAK